MSMKKVVIVTGGAKGLGAETAKQLSSCGYAVCVNYLSSKPASGFAVQADIRFPQDVKRLFDKTERLLGPVTHLVNNAAVHGIRGNFSQQSVSEIQAILETNILGTMLCCQEALNRKHSLQVILNISSRAAITGGNHIAVYASSKAAIEAFSLALQKECSDVRIATISPGALNTCELLVDTAKEIEAILSGL